MDLIKVAGVAEWPVPKTKKKVQSFLGFANFYCRFIKGFSHHAQPLFDLTKKDVPWVWNDNQQKAFNELKNHITSSPVLQFADNSEDDKWHPVLFYSKSLNNVEQNYEIHDREMLVII